MEFVVIIFPDVESAADGLLALHALRDDPIHLPALADAEFVDERDPRVRGSIK